MAYDNNRGGGRGRGPRPEPEEKQFDERVVNIDRVARVVKGGRRFRFRALVVVGDHKGKVGIGISKGSDVTTAVSKAVEVAKKNFVNISIVKGTLPHEAQARIGGANILVKPAAPGTGLIAGGVVRTVLEVTGVSNALSKSIGSSNKINTAYATLAALESIQPSSKWLTRQGIPKTAKSPESRVQSPGKAGSTAQDPKPKAKAGATT